MFGEVTGEGKNNTEKKNLIDLIRLGIFMKDSLDNILLKTGVNRVFAWQVIGNEAGLLGMHALANLILSN